MATSARRGRPSYPDQIRAAKAGNDFYAAMSDRPKLDYGDRIRDIRKRPVKKRRAPNAEPLEHELQKAIIGWWLKAHNTFGLPRFALAAIPNAQILLKHADNRNAVITYLHMEGMRDGIPDLVLFAARDQYHGLLIEMKRSDGVVSGEQHEWHDFLDKQQYYCVVCRSAEDAIKVISVYLTSKHAGNKYV